ncbi:MAG: hypothetical protein C4B58_05145 [Deltaproteobacteria bacterium]|nr:MAG: hypothetical protein C4B58_05145 [Deltaproteobacteria bacterium]
MFKLFMITLVSVSLFGSFYYFIFTASRGSIIIHILIAFILFIYYRGKIGLVWPALGIVMVGLILLYGRSFLLNIATQNLDQISQTHPDLSFYNAIINELSPQYKSLYASLPWIVIGHPDSAMFLDIFTGFLKLIPTRLIGLYLSTSNTTVLNTELITGMSISNIPPGHVAYFIYNLGIIGLILGSIGFGMTCGALDRFFANCRNNDLIRYLYPITSMFLVRWMYFGDPGNYYRSLFGLAFFYFLLICYLLLRRALFR